MGWGREGREGKRFGEGGNTGRQGLGTGEGSIREELRVERLGRVGEWVDGGKGIRKKESRDRERVKEKWIWEW